MGRIWNLLKVSIHDVLLVYDGSFLLFPSFLFVLSLSLFVAYRSPVGRFNNGPIDGVYNEVSPAQMALAVSTLAKRDKWIRKTRREEEKTLNSRIAE